VTHYFKKDGPRIDKKTKSPRQVMSDEDHFNLVGLRKMQAGKVNKEAFKLNNTQSLSQCIRKYQPNSYKPSPRDS
jgi:hypothetical protein